MKAQSLALTFGVLREGPAFRFWPFVLHMKGQGWSPSDTLTRGEQKHTAAHLTLFGHFNIFL